MLYTITDIQIHPGNMGKDCLGNGQHPGIECACDECDYLMCCSEEHKPSDCNGCKTLDCPNSAQKR